MPFRDLLEIQVFAGKGGDGSMSFHREKYKPKGGPDGGHGGRGGSVILRAVENVESLDSLVGSRIFRAPIGGYGSGRLCNGKDGEDLYIQVPIGTVAIDMGDDRLIADLNAVGQEIVIAQGGGGGRGNSAFVSSRRQAPRFAELGGNGESRRLRLELRLIADVGLVGYPNAGKSSLLRALSNANPEVAPYPFTTLAPILGVVMAAQDSAAERLTMADIPGIIEGAHEGKGLGLEFLRHISRTRLLVFVVAADGDPGQTLATLREELNAYDPTLLDLPALVVLNKLDLVDEELAQMIVDELALVGLPVLTTSALEGTNMPDLRKTLFELLPARQQWLETRGIKVEPLLRRAEALSVTAAHSETERIWVVTGGGVEAQVMRFERFLTDAAEYLVNLFERDGLNRALRKVGVQAGDTVKIGKLSFEYFDDSGPKEEKEELRPGMRY
jgi:GTPase